VLVVSYLRETEATFNGRFFLNSQDSVVVPVIPHGQDFWSQVVDHLQALHLSRLEQELTARAHCKTLLLDHR
jgi:hypothetical protein